MNLFAAIVELEKKRDHFALCTVVKISGSTPRKPGAKMIVVDNCHDFGTIIGTIGGGAIEHRIRELALLAIRSRKEEFVTISLRNELGMCCGGEMTIFIEPLAIPMPFICFGAGHIAEALCPLVESLGFQVNIADQRDELLSKPVFANARRYNDTSVFSLNDMPFFDDSFVVIATHDHDLDQTILEGVLKKPAHYIALVGSQRKALMTTKRLSAKGFFNEDLNRVVCPAGLKINAQTPSEIALSIAAQMVKVKNDGLCRVNSSSWQQLAHG